MNTTVLIEALDLTEAQIDAENRTVRQRIIASGESANGRIYDAAVLEAAVPHFQQVKTYANHPSKGEQKDRPERSVREITGWLDNVLFENGALYATRHFARTQAGNDTWAIVEDIVTGKAPPSLMGASINALGKGRVEKRDTGNVLIVESIDRVLSVDDVTVPAAAGGWERLVASDAGDMTAELLKLVTFEEWQESRTDYVERLKKEWKTVRLDDETKRVLAEADQQVKAAETKAAEAATALTAAQAEMTGLQDANTKLTAANALLRRELAINEALATVQLPAVYEKDLREQLMLLAPEKWVERIRTEQSKAQRVMGKQKVAVTGAGYQETPVTHAVLEAFDPMPLPNEDVATWQARVERAQKRN